ncbi:barstar family protein [Streptomyces sp. NPDC002104]
MSDFLPTLTERRSPWVTFTSREDPWAAEAELRARGGLVFRVAGAELDTEARLFRTFARDLGGGYFGYNWDALVDCLGDWFGQGDGDQDVAVVIDGADPLLRADFLAVLVWALCAGAWRANFMVDADGDPHEGWTPFGLHFVLLLDHAPAAAFAERAAGHADVSGAVVGGRLLLTLNADDTWGGDAVWPPAGAA